MDEQLLQEHDVVELTEQHDATPAGARGALVAPVREGWAVVELAGDDVGLDAIVDVPVGKLRAAEPA